MSWVPRGHLNNVAPGSFVRLEKQAYIMRTTGDFDESPMAKRARMYGLVWWVWTGTEDELKELLTIEAMTYGENGAR